MMTSSPQLLHRGSDDGQNSEEVEADLKTVLVVVLRSAALPHLRKPDKQPPRLMGSVCFPLRHMCFDLI